MADVDTVQLSQEHGAIRHDIAVESARIGSSIADTRQESAENFGHTRRDIQSTSADAARQIAAGFGDTRYNIAERAGDIRREVATGFDKTGDLVAATSSDIRLEQQHQAYELSKQSGQETNEIVKEGLKESFHARGDIKDTRFDLADRVGNSADRIVDHLSEHDSKVSDRFFTVGRDTQDLRAQVIAQQQQLVAGFLGVSKDTELFALKTQLDAKENTRYLADKIVYDGEKTRGLINDLKYHDLNRGLVERNTALINCEQDRDTWRHRHDDARFSARQDQFGSQFAQLQTQIQAFASQLQETRQGMVNFGTMAGVGQSSTSNNVR